MTKPRAKTAAPEAAPPLLATPRSKPLILVVDDFQDNREMYAEFLAFAGFDALQAGNGLEALELAFSRRPDVIIMDLSLPGMDGWEATRRLKADPATARIPVIALTAQAMAGDRDQALAAGCDDYVTKPIDVLWLITLLRERFA